MRNRKKVVRPLVGYSRHHRRCRSKGGTNHPSNISVVKNNQHRAYHVLFGNKDPEEIAEILNVTWISPDCYFICVRRRR